MQFNLLAFHPATPDDHSPLAPPLPIPNRTVKRRHADDSTEFPCESRSSSGTLKANGPIDAIGPLAFHSIAYAPAFGVRCEGEQRQASPATNEDMPWTTRHTKM